MKITRHGKERSKERLGISKKLAEKNAKKALKYGLKRSDTTGNLHKYLTKQFYYNDAPETTTLRIYHQHVYIFRCGMLITIIRLPHNLALIADKLEDRLEKKDDTPAPY